MATITLRRDAKSRGQRLKSPAETLEGHVDGERGARIAHDPTCVGPEVIETTCFLAQLTKSCNVPANCHNIKYGE